MDASTRLALSLRTGCGQERDVRGENKLESGERRCEESTTGNRCELETGKGCEESTAGNRSELETGKGRELDTGNRSELESRRNRCELDTHRQIRDRFELNSI